MVPAWSGIVNDYKTMLNNRLKKFALYLPDVSTIFTNILPNSL
jgi:hypothetical protein